MHGVKKYAVSLQMLGFVWTWPLVLSTASRVRVILFKFNFIDYVIIKSFLNNRVTVYVLFICQIHIF